MTAAEKIVSLFPEVTRKCRLCGEVRPLEDFNRQQDTKGGRRFRCRDCVRKYHAKWIAKYRATSPSYVEYHRKRNLSAKFGLVPEDYDVMLAAQNGVCGICRRPPGISVKSRQKKPEVFCVDHDHTYPPRDKRGHRGLLCDICNRALGLMKDNPVALRNAAEYLERHLRGIR